MDRFNSMTVLLVCFSLALLSPSSISVFPSISAVCGSPHQKVLLSDVSALSLEKSKFTTGRRSSPIPQLTCKSGPCEFAPSSVRCSNDGTDGFDVQWSCKADLPSGIRLGQIEVACEGFDYPDDPYILRGSCGLEFTLEGRTTNSNNQYPYSSYQHSDSDTDSFSYSNPYSSGRSSSQSFLPNAFTFVVIAIIVWTIFKACTSPATHNRNNGGGGGGGGDYPGGGFPGGGTGGFGFGTQHYGNPGCAAPPVYGAGGGGGPGFWTGAGLGGLAGYFAGRRNNYGGGYAAPGFGGGGIHRQARFAGGGGGGFAAAPATSSSTAYGGTRRR